VITALLRGDHNSALFTTMRTSAAATIISVIVAIPVGLVLARTDLWGAKLWRALWLTWLVLPPYLLAMGMRALLHPASGLLPTALRLNIDNEAGICVVLGIAHVPLLLLGLVGPLHAIDPSLEEAARMCGQSPWRALITLALPLVRRPLLAAIGAAWVASMASYGVAALLGGPATPSVVVVPGRIMNILQMGSASSLREALWLAWLLLALGAALLAAARRLGGPAIVVTGKPQRPRLLALGPLRPIVTVAVAMITVAFVVMPLLATVWLGTRLHLDGGGTTSKHLLEAWQLPIAQRALTTSLWTSLLAGALAALVALSLMAPAPKWWSRTRQSLVWATDAVWATPGTVVALALLVATQRDVQLVMANTISLRSAWASTGWVLLFAYWIKHAAMALRMVRDAAGQIDPALADAARVSGAPPTRAFDDVWAPLLWPAAAAACGAVFLASLLELTMSALLQTPRASSIGVVIFQLQEYGNPQGAAALAAVLVIATLVVRMVVVGRGRHD
jgi:iron(III) transport system permease protein